jgi:hypothetical protein
MGKSSPPTPDYTGAAEATAAGSREVTDAQTWANRPNQTNPWGSTTWDATATIDPATGKSFNKWTQNQTLNPESQAALDAQMAVTTGRSQMGEGMIDRTSNELGQPMDWEQFGQQNRGATAEAIDMSGLPSGVGSVEAKQYNAPTLNTNLDYAGASGVGQADTQNRLDYSSANAIGGNDQYRNEAENALYDRSSKRLDTRFGQSDEAIQVKLASQGLAPGDQAYDAAMKNYSDSKNDAYSSAQNDAITMGGQEASRNFGMDTTRRGITTGEEDRSAAFRNQEANQQFGRDMSRRGLETGEIRDRFNAYNSGLQNQQGMDLAAGGQQYAEELGAGNFANQARAQSLQEQTGIKDRAYINAQDEANNANALRTSAINEEQTRRQQSLNEMNAVLSGQQVNPATMAPVQMASRSAGTDYTGAMQDTYNADLNRTNASNMGMQGLMSGATSVAGMFSDRRLKKNIERVGTWLTYPLYKFQYIWGEWAVGIMSDEINQDAVSVHPSGFDIVDYMKVR